MNPSEIITTHVNSVAPLYAAPSDRTRAKLWPLLVHTLSVYQRLKAYTDQADLSPEQSAQLLDIDGALALQLLRLEPAPELDPDEVMPDAWRELVGDGQNLPLAVGPQLLLLGHGQPVGPDDFFRPYQPDQPPRGGAGFAILAILAIAIAFFLRR